MHSTAAPLADRRPATLLPHLRAHALLIVLVAGYAAVSLVLSLAYPATGSSEKVSVLFLDFAKMLPAMAYFLLIWRYVHMVRVVRPQQRMAWMAGDLRRMATDRGRLVPGAIAVVLMIVVMLSFAQLKRLIPILQPFDWDIAFAAMDRTLHLGADPWRILHAVMGHPLVVTAVTGAYNFWMFLLYFVLLFACFNTGNPAARMQYLVAFILTWGIGGNLVATVFSSAGPVYFARLGLGDMFAPLMQLLQTHAAAQPITVLETQDLLWAHYAAAQSLNGISAFPSMHVASSVLMALYAFRLNRGLGWAMTGFATVIMLGSVLLAWHYAVDGYAGAIIAMLAWPLAGWLMRRFPRLVPPAPAPGA